MKYLSTSEGMILAQCEECGKILKFYEYQLDEISQGIECFCGNISNEITGLPHQRENKVQVTYIQPQHQTVDVGIPKCPTCGSSNVQRISGARKVGGAVMFGLFSSSIRKSFMCKDCGYRW